MNWHPEGSGRVALPSCTRLADGYAPNGAERLRAQRRNNMKSHAVSIGTALAVIAGIGVASAQTLPTTSVDSLVSAAKNAAGLDWPGTFLRLCVVPPPAAPGGAR